MSQTPVDLTNFSDDQIKDLATRCLECLDLADKVQAILPAFHSNEERDELIQWLSDENDAEIEFAPEE